MSPRANLLRGERPVVEEDHLEVTDRRSSDHHAEIPPLVLFPLRPHVLLPDVHPSAEAGRPVGDEKFPVIAEVSGPLPAEREGGEELHHFPACTLQRPNDPAQRAPRSYRVQQEAHTDARLDP